MSFIKDNKYKIALGVLVVIAIGVAYWYFHGRAKDTLIDTPTVTDAVVKQNTTLEVKPKTSKTDNDLEVTQTYKATINGAKVEVPVVTKETAKDASGTGYGTKAVVTQEIDMTNVVNSALSIEREKVKMEYKKNWEIGTGIGSHNGDLYIPVEIQRNYAKDKAISAEVHIDVDKAPSVNGWEVKHKWKF